MLGGMNEDTITVVGRAGADAALKIVNGTQLAEFRLASTSRRKLDDGTWVDKHTNWFSVEAWGEWAPGVAAAVRRGHSVIVRGELRIEDWESGERRGTSVKIRADHVSHDLRWKTAKRDGAEGDGSPARSVEGAPQPEPAQAAGASPQSEPEPSGWYAPVAQPEPAERVPF